MRAAGIALALLLLAVPAPGHEGGAHHVVPFTAVLGPGATGEYPLEFEETSLFAGWLFVFVARTFNGTAVDAALVLGGVVEASWTVPAGHSRHTLTIPETGTYGVRLTNPGSATVVVDFYFDQSCNCAGKVLPAGFDEAMVVFNFDFTAGERVEVLFNEPAAMTTRVAAATRRGGGGTWPADFAVFLTSENAETVAVGNDTVRVHRLRFTAATTGTHYFVVEPKELLMPDPPPDALLITPYVDVLPPEPFPWALVAVAVVAGVAVAVFLLWRRKSF